MTTTDTTSDLGFLTPPLDSRITCTRADTTAVASYFDASGTMRFAPVNAIRNSTMVGAVVGTPGSWPTNATKTANGVTLSIAALPIVNGIQCLDIQAAGTPTATTVDIYMCDAIAATNGVVYTSSLSTALVGGSLANVTSVMNQVILGGVSTAANTTATLSRTAVNFTGAGLSVWACSVRLNVTIGQPINLTMRIGAPQFELGPVATQYIPTSGTAAGGPRFDYDPVTLAPKGLLIEEARTNSIRNSTMLGAVAGTPGTLPTNWSYTINSGLSTQIVGSGIQNGINYIDVRFFGTCGNPWFNVNFDTLSPVSAGDWTVSAYIAVLSGDVSVFYGAGITLVVPIGGGQGNVQSSAFVPSATMRRYSYTYTATGSPTSMTPSMFFALSGAGASTDVTFRIGAPQLEVGSFPTSYIPTAGSTASRAADLLTMPTPAGFSATAGTVVVETVIPKYSPSANHLLWELSNAGDVNNDIRCYVTPTGTNFFGTIVGGGVAYTALSGPAVTAGATHSLSYGWTTTTETGVLDGGAVTSTGYTGTLPTLTTFVLGGWSTHNQYLNGYLRRIRYWNRALSNAEHQAATTLSSNQYGVARGSLRKPSTRLSLLGLDAGNYLVSAEGIVRNNLFRVAGRSGYLPTEAATAESQALLLRGYARAYQVTRNGAYLQQAQNLAEALIQYFFGLAPPATGAWPAHWLVNGSTAFHTKGPASASGAAYDGVVGASVSFSSGIAALPGDLSDVFLVYSGGLTWANVFSGLDSGTSYPIQSWVDQDGYVHTPTSVASSPQSVQAPGTLTLVDRTVSGSHSVNYARWQSATISHTTPFEAWPMWRPLQLGEGNTAADSIHWMIDGFDLLRQIDSDPRWPLAKAALLRMWTSVTTIEQSSYIFRKDIGQPYNSFPLSYFYAHVGAGVVQDPTTYCTYVRDSSGYMVFGLPLDATRSDFIVQNAPLFLSWASRTAISVEVLSSIAVPLVLSVTPYAAAGNLTRSLRTNGSTMLIPIAGLEDWTGVSLWQAPTGASYAIGSVAASAAGCDDLSGVNVPVFRIVWSGSGGYGMTVSGWTVTTPPVLAYATTNAVKLIVKDAAGWRWSMSLPFQPLLRYLSTGWSDFAIDGSQDNGGTPPTSPVTTGPIQIVQFEASAGATLNLASISSAQPAHPAASGSIASVSLTYAGTAAVTLSVGDVSLRDIV